MKNCSKLSPRLKLVVPFKASWLSFPPLSFSFLFFSYFLSYLPLFPSSTSVIPFTHCLPSLDFLLVFFSASIMSLLPCLTYYSILFFFFISLLHLPNPSSIAFLPLLFLFASSFFFPASTTYILRCLSSCYLFFLLSSFPDQPNLVSIAFLLLFFFFFLFLSRIK